MSGRDLSTIHRPASGTAAVSWELGLVDPPDPPPGVAVVALSEQDLDQESFMGQAFSGGGPSEPTCYGAHGG